MNLIKQLFRFAGIGLISTALHVVVAMIAAEILHLPPLLANFTGFAVAVTFSYFGQSRVTFRTELHHKLHAPRFASSALTGLALSSMITEIVVVRLGAPFAAAMALMVIIVPAATFTLMRFWVFNPGASPADHKPPA